MSQVKSTKDYHMFKKNDANRPIDRSNLKRLINSIKTQNMLEYRPIVVDKDFRIIDGQHRLEAAKHLGIEVFYQMNKQAEDQDMILLNTTQKKWALEDYVNYYITKGNTEYIKYKEYAYKIGVDLMEMINSIARGGNDTKTIRNGALKFFSKEAQQSFEEQTQKYKKFIEDIKKHVLSNSAFIDSVRFEKGLKMVIKNEDVDWDLFVRKATIKSDALKICPTSNSYYQLFLDIYNWKNKNKVFVGVKEDHDHPDEYEINIHE